MKKGVPAEAILHYTHAIKLEPSNHLLYSNRSYAFLKLDQYYLALEDANETIKLQPSWPKVRKHCADCSHTHTKNFDGSPVLVGLFKCLLVIVLSYSQVKSVNRG